MTHGDGYLLHCSQMSCCWHCIRHKDSNLLAPQQLSNSLVGLSSQYSTTLTKNRENKPTITIPILKHVFLFSFPVQMAWPLFSHQGK